MRAALACLLAGACASDPSATPEPVQVKPPYGPLAGGSTVRIDGTRFTSQTRVLFGGREAPYVRAVSDAKLDVVIPPGDHTGDAEVVVIDKGGYTSAHGLFRYSDPPTIATVTPSDVWIGSTDTIVTITGSGFLDENAGDNQLVVGGTALGPVTASSDGAISFVAPNGAAFTRSDIELRNSRGRAFLPRALRNTPGQNPGLLLFPKFTSTFVVFYDPVAQTSTSIGWPTTSTDLFTTVVRDADDNYWAVDYNYRVGLLDLEKRTFTATGMLTSARIPASVRVGNDVIAVLRSYYTGASLVRFYPSGVQTAALGTAALYCCGSFGLATDGTTVWLTQRKDWSSYTIQTVDLDTGALGTPVVLTPPGTFRIEELHFFGGTLYATGTTGGLATIDPVSGAMTMVPGGPGLRFSAMETYE